VSHLIVYVTLNAINNVPQIWSYQNVYLPEASSLKFTYPTWIVNNTLKIEFNVTFHLELPNAITIYCIYLIFFQQKGQIGCLDIIDHYLYLVKKARSIIKNI